MKKVMLGNSGIECSKVGLGTWAMGGWMWGGNDDAAALVSIKAALDAEVNFLDTAPAYGLGHAEELVGKAIQGRRENVVLATKCGLVWHTQKGTHFFNENGHDVYRYLGRDSIEHELNESLKRLGTDYVDLYYTHWQDETTPIAETMEALLALKAKGKIRAIGISNSNAAVLAEYLSFGSVDAVQEKYSLIDREIESELLPLCRSNNVSIHGYSSLALGLLAGPIDPKREFTGDDQRKDNPRFSVANRESLAAFFEDIRLIREFHGCSYGQLMITWATKYIDIALCGARTSQQARENANAGYVELSEQEISAIAGAAAKHLKSLN